MNRLSNSLDVTRLHRSQKWRLLSALALQTFHGILHSALLLVSCLSLQKQLFIPVHVQYPENSSGYPERLFFAQSFGPYNQDVLIVQECNFTDTESARRGRRIYEHTSYQQVWASHKILIMVALFIIEVSLQLAFERKFNNHCYSSKIKKIQYKKFSSGVI